MEQSPILLTGASGYVGARLLDELVARGRAVRAMTRHPDRGDPRAGVEPVPGDVVSGQGLDAALNGVEVAYYLVHSMGRGSGPTREFASRDREGATRFGDAARRAGVRRVIYLGGLGPTGPQASEHLRSRHEVAELLGERVSELAYMRAAMIIGSGSASFEMLRALVHRLPVMVCPRWIDTRSQPIAVADVVRALADAGERAEAAGEVQLGGADVLTYRAMMERFARVMGRRAPRIVRVPVLSPRLSSYWVSLVTPVERGLVAPLVDGLKSEMIVQRPPPAGLNDDPAGFEASARAALYDPPLRP